MTFLLNIWMIGMVPWFLLLTGGPRRLRLFESNKILNHESAYCLIFRIHQSGVFL